MRTLPGIIAAVLLSACGAFAQQTPATQPSRRPMLEELNRETEELYREVNASLVRVQMPQPHWMHEVARLTWQPATSQPVHPSTTQPTRPEQALARIDQKSIDPYMPNNVGLLLDDAGHILVPLYIEPETVTAATPIRFKLASGKVIHAKFIGSDRQTNLTLIQISQAGGKPVQFSPRKLADGSLVVSVSPLDGSARLGLWNGGQQEPGIIFTLDGSVAGIARFGQFLSASSCRLIGEQLSQYGTVRRATVGLTVSEIRKDDPLRDQLPLLGSRIAMRIDAVLPDSPAAKAGLSSGDLLLSVAGESVSDIPSFSAAIAAHTGPTEFEVMRGTAVRKYTVNLELK